MPPDDETLRRAADAVDPCGSISRIELYYMAWLHRRMAQRLEHLAESLPLMPASGTEEPLDLLRRFLGELPELGELNFGR